MMNVGAALVFWLGAVSLSRQGSVFASTTITSHVEECRAAGFDVWQLSCSTCSLLPDSIPEKCLSCCQSYKTLEKQAKRYQGAVLVDNGFSSAVEEFIREDKEQIMRQKKSMKIKKSEGGGGRGGLFQMYAEPSIILFFNKLPTNIESLSVQMLSDDAEEIMTLDGFSRDDIREMLLALLDDK
jgi:hypothetical protein